jgi:transposase
MLTVNHFEIIRRKVLLDGHSQRDVARELGHSRKTVAKAMEHPSPPGYTMGKARASPVMDRYRAMIEQWMESDKTAPPKQRHTAQRMFERLRDEQEFSGDAGTVRRFVARLKAQQSQEAFMPLVFGAGEEAQVDWGEAKVIENGTQRTVQLFCMRLSHSKASFVHPYERATMEAFLDGHVRAFEFFDGVPRRLAYDNLKSAVTHVGRGRERQLNERFMQLRSFYLFDTRFCNVESGNEKGDVENLVKRSQRTYLTPVPEVSSIAGDPADQLLLHCRWDLLKVDDRQRLSRGELLAGRRRAKQVHPHGLGLRADSWNRAYQGRDVERGRLFADSFVASGWSERSRDRQTAGSRARHDQEGVDRGDTAGLHADAASEEPEAGCVHGGDRPGACRRPIVPQEATPHGPPHLRAVAG